MIVPRLNIGHLQKIYEAMDRLRVVARDEIEVQLPTRAALGYRDLLRKNILSQRYATPAWAYTEKYAKWKKNRGTDRGYLILGGDLVGAIQVTAKGRFWVVEIPPGLMDGGGKSYGKGKPRRVALYARIQEEGGRMGKQNHKPRPVWQPTREEYATAGFLMELAAAKKRIGEAWKR